jgi:lipooligosaccharide transport system permease protein
MTVVNEQSRTWQGALKVVDSQRAIRFGWWYVAEYRLRNLMKWISAVIAFGIGNPVLYLASIGFGVGSLVNHHGNGLGPDGVPYLTFLAPALLATAAIQSTFEEVTFPTMHGLKWENVYYAMTATAVTPNQIATGVMVVAFLRGLFTTIIYWVVLAIAGAFHSPTALLAIPAGMIAGVSFAAVMLALTLRFIDSQNFLASIGRFVITPLFMFSGTFFPLSAIPIWLRWIGWISPLWHATDLGRVLMYGRAVPGWLVATHAIYLVVLGAVAFIIAQRQITKKMTK